MRACVHTSVFSCERMLFASVRVKERVNVIFSLCLCLCRKQCI